MLVLLGGWILANDYFEENSYECSIAFRGQAAILHQLMPSEIPSKGLPRWSLTQYTYLYLYMYIKLPKR